MACHITRLIQNCLFIYFITYLYTHKYRLGVHDMLHTYFKYGYTVKVCNRDEAVDSSHKFRKFTKY